MWSILFGITIGCLTQTVDGGDPEPERAEATVGTNRPPGVKPTRAERLCGKIDPEIAHEIRSAAEKFTPPAHGAPTRGHAIRGVREILSRSAPCANKACDSPDIQRYLVAVVEHELKRRKSRMRATDPHQLGLPVADLKRFCSKVDLSLVTEFAQYAADDPVFDRDQPRASSLRAMREWCRLQRQSGYELDRCLIAVIDKMRASGIIPMKIGEDLSGLSAMEWQLAYAVLEVKRKGFQAWTRRQHNREGIRGFSLGPKGSVFRDDYVNDGLTRYPFPRLLPKLGSIGMIDDGRVDQALSPSQAVVFLPWADGSVVVRDLTNAELTASRQRPLSNRAFRITGQQTYTGASGEPITLHTASPVEVDWVKLRAWLDVRLPKKKRR